MGIHDVKSLRFHGHGKHLAIYFVTFLRKSGFHTLRLKQWSWNDRTDPYTDCGPLGVTLYCLDGSWDISAKYWESKCRPELYPASVLQSRSLLATWTEIQVLIAIVLTQVEVKIMLRQSVSLSWNRAPIRDLRPDLFYYQTVADLLMWGAVSDQKTGLSISRVTVSSNMTVISVYNIWFTWYLMYVQYIQGLCQPTLSIAQ
jgi:hypothetical protein